MSDSTGARGTITPPEGSRARLIHDAIQRHDIRLSPDGRVAPACSVDLATEIDEILRPDFATPTAMRKLKGEYTEDGWKGTPPAEGSRRALILDTLKRTALSYVPSNSTAIHFADAVESALLQTTIEDEEAHSSPGVGVPGLAQGEVGKTDFEDQLRYAAPSLAPIHHLLDTIAVPRTAFESGDDGPQRILTLAERVEILVRRYSRAVTEDGHRAVAVEQAEEKLERFEKQADRLDEICEERWKCIGDLEDRLKRIYELAVDIGGPPRQLCDLHADLAEIAGIARLGYPPEPPSPGEIREMSADEVETFDDSTEPLWKVEVDRGFNHARNAIRAWLGL